MGANVLLRSPPMRRFPWPALLIPVLLSVGCNDKKPDGGPGGVRDAVRLKGGGSSFIDPIMGKWRQEYQAYHGTEIDYTKSGSADGIKNLIDRAHDFGCSDAPMKKDQLEKAKAAGGDVVHVPMIMGAVAVAYNVPNVPELKLSGPILADIYLGKLTTWNDPAITALNPGVALPDLKITPVYRSDGSGTTNIFTEYLNKVSPEFANNIPASTNPTWPKIGLGQKGSD